MSKKISLVCAALDCNEIYFVLIRQDKEPSKYCSTTCRNRARRHRQAEWTRQANAPKSQPVPKPTAKPQSKRNIGSALDALIVCPHPYKRVFRTPGEARAEIERLGDDTLEHYKCRCGALHLGHPSSRMIEKRAMMEYKQWAKLAD